MALEPELIGSGFSSNTLDFWKFNMGSYENVYLVAIKKKNISKFCVQIFKDCFLSCPKQNDIKKLVGLPAIKN
jgi:hypothetical protein